MAFGQELKDFVSGFTTGYNLVESKEEKEWKREERRMKKEQHERTGRWGDEDRAYRQGRADRSDFESNRSFNFNKEKFDWGVGVDARNFKRARDRDARSDEQFDQGVRERAEERKLRERDRTLKMREGTGGAIPDEVDGFTPILPGDTSVEPEAIPPPSSYLQDDETGSTTTGSVDPASYTDHTTTGSIRPKGSIKPASYTGNSEVASYGYEPQSGQEIAWNLVQDLQDDFGMPEHIAIGVVGQLAGETGGFKHLQEINPVVAGSRGGGGYAQWTADRRRAFEEYAGKRNPTSYAENYAFLRHELANTPEGRVLEALRGARTSEEAGRIFTDKFLRPGVKNYAGRDAWTRRVESLFGGGKALNASVGGPVTAIPDEEEEPQVTSESNQYAIPAPEYGGDVVTEEPKRVAQADTDGDSDGDSASNDTDHDDTPTDDPYETARRAAREGLNHAMKQGQLDAQTAIDDPERRKYEERFIRGYGAAPQQVVRQMMDKIDPEKKMTANQRNMLAMANTYRFFWDRGEPEKAKEAAASLIQYYNQSFQQFSALAKAAGENGDIDNAVKAAVAAYAQIPNGRDLQVAKNEDGTLTVKVTDEKSGKEIANHVMPPEKLLAEAMNFSPKTFYDELQNAAGVPTEKYDDASLDDMSKVSDSIRATIEADFADSGLTKEGMAGIEDIATDIAKVKQNGVSPAQAVRLAAGMAAASPDDISVKDERGHPDLAQVTFGGHKFVMSKTQLKQLMGAYKERETKAAGEKKKAEDNAKWWSDNGKLGMKVIQPFIDEFKGDNPDKPGPWELLTRGSSRRGSSKAEAPTSAIPDNSEEERDRALDDYLNVR